MDISVIDASNYFKGLLLLIRKDKKISKGENDLIKRIGHALGFDHSFIEEAVSEILYNRHISIKPPVFTNRQIAEKFIKDGLVLAASDSEIHPDEEKWLFSVAESNGIEREWIYVEKKIILSSKKERGRLEVDALNVLY